MSDGYCTKYQEGARQGLGRYLNSTVFVLYDGVSFMKKYKAIVKKSAFRKDGMWQSPGHHQWPSHLTTNDKQLSMLNIPL